MPQGGSARLLPTPLHARGCLQSLYRPRKSHTALASIAASSVGARGPSSRFFLHAPAAGKLPLAAEPPQEDVGRVPSRRGLRLVAIGGRGRERRYPLLRRNPQDPLQIIEKRLGAGVAIVGLLAHGPQDDALDARIDL